MSKIPTSVETFITQLVKKARMIITSPNRKKLVILEGKTVSLLDVKSRQQKAILELDDARCMALFISNNNHLMVAWTRDGAENENNSTISIYKNSSNTKKWTCIQKIKSIEDDVIRDVHIIPNTNLVALSRGKSIPGSDRIQIFNPHTNKYIRSFSVSDSVPDCGPINFLDSTTMVTFDRYRINFWDLKSKSEKPIHSIETKSILASLWGISDKQFMIKDEELIKIYNVEPLELVSTTHIGEYLIDAVDIPRNVNFYNLDNKNFISTYSSKKSNSVELNLWRLSDNRFETLISPEGFPLKLTSSRSTPVFIPLQEDKGNWLCVAGGQSIQNIHIPAYDGFAPVKSNSPSQQ